MLEPAIAVLRVSSPLVEILESEARTRGLRLIDEAAEVAGLSEGRLQLCVTEISGSERAALSRVRGAIKLAGRAPVVVLARDFGAAFGASLQALGVARIIDLPSPQGDVVSAIFATLKPRETPSVSPLIGNTPAISRLREELVSIADTPITVLIRAEHGIERETVAREIHDRSDRRNQSFVSLDGGQGLEEETIQQSALGTLFLDDVLDLDARSQGVLARALSLRGYDEPTPVGVLPRMIVGTSSSLADEVERGTLSRDLYFRLTVVELMIPPLRERREDIPILARSMLDAIADTVGAPRPRAADGFYKRLMDHDWPGNDRELHRALERLVVSTRTDWLERADAHQVLDHFSRTDSVRDIGYSEEAEQIAELLRRAGGNISRAARLAGIPRTTFHRRVEEFDLRHLIPKG